jgi:hypothetical protein
LSQTKWLDIPFTVAAGKVAYARALYLYDPHAEVGELARGERGGDRLLEGDDHDAF